MMFVFVWEDINYRGQFWEKNMWRCYCENMDFIGGRLNIIIGCLLFFFWWDFDIGNQYGRTPVLRTIDKLIKIRVILGLPPTDMVSHFSPKQDLGVYEVRKDFQYVCMYVCIYIYTWLDLCGRTQELRCAGHPHRSKACVGKSPDLK